MRHLLLLGCVLAAPTPPGMKPKPAPPDMREGMAVMALIQAMQADKYLGLPLAWLALTGTQFHKQLPCSKIFTKWACSPARRDCTWRIKRWQIKTMLGTKNKQEEWCEDFSPRDGAPKDDLPDDPFNQPAAPPNSPTPPTPPPLMPDGPATPADTGDPGTIPETGPPCMHGWPDQTHDPDTPCPLPSDALNKSHHDFTVPELLRANRR